MKTAALFAVALHATLSTAALHGQGSLTPPGPPAPTMKTLDQIEARTIVNATNTPGDATNTFIISAPGSYYLTGNITGAAGKHGISIQANDVTLDLNGCALISGGGATRGINTTTPLTGFCIRNGSVSGWTGGGVRADFAVTRVEKLSLSGNTGATGLIVGNGSMIMDCVASGNATGFFCPDRTQISHCISTLNTGDGFDCTSYVNILDCTSSRNGGDGIVTLGACNVIRCSATRNLPSGDGINAGDGCTIVDCTAGNNGANGIRVSSHSTVRGCTSNTNVNTGIFVGDGCHIRDNTCDANGNGIAAINSGNRVEGNTCNSNTFTGFQFNSPVQKNLVIRNSAGGNGTNYNIGPANAAGPIVDMSAGGTISTSSPWANIVH